MGEEPRGAGGGVPRLFERTCLVSCRDVCLSARCALGQRQLIALVMRSGDLTLYYERGQSGQKPVMKHVPWFTDGNKRVAALSFDPPGNWLVVAAHDGSVYVVPALPLVDPGAVPDRRWPSSDVTTFPAPAAGCGGRPTAVAWWRDAAVLGTDQGELCFLGLCSGMQLGGTRVDVPVKSLHVCKDDSLGSVYLLVTGRQRCQWKLLLEHRGTDYRWPLEGPPAPRLAASGFESSSSGSHSSAEVDAGKGSGSPHLPTARSRLQGLKQLSVEKLAHLKLRLAETRLRNTNSFHSAQREFAGVDDGDEAVGGENPGEPRPGVGPAPERVSSLVGDTFLCPQYARERHLLSGYHAPSSILTIHSISMDMVPFFVYKLPPDCDDVLVTDRFLYVTDSARRTLSIVSCHFAESRLDCDVDHNVDSVVGKFEFEEDERILSLHRQPRCEDRPRGSSPAERRHARAHKKPPGPTSSHSCPGLSAPGRDPAAVEVADGPPVDSCTVVTTRGIYQVVLRQKVSQVFMDLVLHHQQLETAEKVALMFGLPLQELLEHAGDVKLAARDFPRAIALYKLSKCSHLKSVLKFAAGGHSAELLGFIALLFSSSGPDLAPAERVHLSNLAVMAHTEQLLRAPPPKTAPFKSFLKFLQENQFYDEVLAVNVAGQTGLWEVLRFLAAQRGLHQEVLDVVASVLCTLVESLSKPSAPAAATAPLTLAAVPEKGSRLAPLLDAGLWMCVTDPTLLPAMLAKPHHCRAHLRFVATCLPHLQQFALQRLAALYDPSSPLLRPGLRRLLGAGGAHQACGSCGSFSDGGGGASAGAESLGEEPATLLGDMVQQFVLVLLYLVKKLVTAHVFIPRLVVEVRPPAHCNLQDVDDLSPAPLPFQMTPLSAGFGHAALIRNGTVHTWGSAAHGCLGTGPTLSQYGGVQPVSFFPRLGLEVLSVCCGRLHTIALTNNGVFTWGSSQYGQLGVGRTVRSSRPRLVDGLSRERVSAVSAGQYHSLALTADGRVYSWGWGVHGQLGHGSIEDLHIPALVRALSGKVCVQACGGYAHSLVLTAEGQLFAFGSGMFGQLGHGGTAKSSVPVAVCCLPESVGAIATGYFHNLAVGASGQLYVWGSSPQVLRVQAQAQKKARLLHQHQHQQPFPLPNGTGPGGCPPEGEPVDGGVPDPGEETPLANGDVRPPAAACTPQRISGGSDVLRPRADLALGAMLSPTDYVLQSVVSPTMEFKGLAAAPAGPNHPVSADCGKAANGLEALLPGQPEGPEDGQVHLVPQLVDTSLVAGRIVQVSCGCHHSALVAEDGALYVWGRNLDGQIGNGARKEVPRPTPLSVTKPSVGGGKLNISGVMSGRGDQLRVQQVCCGCEFTVAVDASGKLWAWGSNASGQLGKPPNEESRGLEGKLFMLKTAKRVIKLPHGSGNSSDVPREVPGVPSSTISYKYGVFQNHMQGRGPGEVCPPLSTLEQPSYGPVTLHYAVQRFHGCYDSAYVLGKCVELENYQTAAKLAALDRNYPAALSYQLKALALAIPESVLRAGRTPAAGETEDGAKLRVAGDGGKGSFILVLNNNASLELSGEADAVADTPLAAVNSDGASGSGERTGSLGRNGCMSEQEATSVAAADGPGPKAEAPTGARKPGASPMGRGPRDARPQGEMHAFAVEGGKEQMFEAGQCVSSPDSASSLADTPARRPSWLPCRSPEGGADCGSLPTLSSGVGSVHGSPLEDQHEPLVVSDYKELMLQASVIVEYYVSVMEEDSHTAVNKLLHQGIQFWLQHSLPMDSLESLLVKHMSKFFYPLGLLMFCQRPGCVPREQPGSEEAQAGDDVTAALLAKLSSKFSLQLCSALLAHVQQGKQSPEFIEALAQRSAAGPAPGGARSQEEVMEEVFQNLGAYGRPGQLPAQPCIRFKDVSVLSRGEGCEEREYVFSCGHHHNGASLRRELEGGLLGLSRPLPNTARMLREVFAAEPPSLHLACPACVLSYLGARHAGAQPQLSAPP